MLTLEYRINNFDSDSFLFIPFYKFGKSWHLENNHKKQVYIY